jgi:hypothetical protein
MEIEQLNQKHTEQIVNLSEELYKWLDDNVPKSDKYSHPNLCLNLLTVTIFRLGYTFFKDDISLQKSFIKNITDTLTENFKVNNER